MNPTEEGRRSFMEKEPVDACPYEGQAKVLWLKGYHKQELDEVKEEQSNILESMGFYSHPLTGLEDTIRDLQSKISKLNNDLSRSRSV